MHNTEDKLFKSAVVLGMTIGKLEGILYQAEMGMATRDQLENLLSYLHVSIDDLFYCEHKKLSEPFKGKVFVKEPEKPKQEPYNKEWQNRCVVCGYYHPHEPDCPKPNCA